jgi:Amt family ammonium transporter
LATITPGAGYVGIVEALLIGVAAGGLSYVAINWKGRLGYDDSLDVVGIHAVGGVLGMLCTGLFASKAVNAGGADGLFFGNPSFFGVQLLAIVAVASFCAAFTYGLLKLVDRILGLRISHEEERMGLDLSQHDERAYS